MGCCTSGCASRCCACYKFKAFITRGDVIDTAVGIVMGLAFKAIIDSVVDNFIMPLVGLIFSSSSYEEWYFTVFLSEVRTQEFHYGLFIAAVIRFLFVALVIFYVIVLPYQFYKDRKAVAIEEKFSCPFCISEVNPKASACPNCARDIPPIEVKAEVPSSETIIGEPN